MIIMIIKNGLVVDPALGLSEKMDLAIENGTILKIEKNIDTDQVSNDTEVLDATGLVVAPGLIDTHVHFRDPGLLIRKIFIPVHLLLQKADLQVSSAWQILHRSLTVSLCLKI